ncbi:MAG: hypothetical protein LBD22_00260 [Spirochaetaceae bacterium]|nr:hypothetical protein [Spirochaetaceae bacterium]
MAAYITKKIIIGRLMVPGIAAGAVLMLLVHAGTGTSFGAEYDFLSSFRQNPPIAREILIIDTSNGAVEQVIPPSVAAHVVMTLSEMSAGSLVLLAPLLGGGGGEQAGGSELLYHFDEEFKTITGNIRNLFDGIRLGSIAPQDASRFVSETQRLTEQSKERLLRAAIRSEEAGALRLEKAMSVFGKVFIPADARLTVVNTSGETPVGGIHTAGYSRVFADQDGRLRRIVPYIQGEDATIEHVVWTALKTTKPNTREIEAMLDLSGALLVEIPKGADDFRTIPLKLFLEYDDLDKTLYRLLAAEMSFARYGDISPDRYPPFLYERAAEIQERLLDEHNDALKARWVDMRTAYYAALGNFFSSELRQQIELSFEKLIAEEKLDAAGTEKLIALRDAELKKYDIVREVYQELTSIREMLMLALNNAFCLLGSIEGSVDETARWERLNPVRNAALLANALLTSAVITVVDRRDVMVNALVAVLIVILIMVKLRLAASFITGGLLCIIIYGGFCYAYIHSGRWIDPLVPALSSLSAALCSVVCAYTARSRMARSVRLSFAEVISPYNLRRLIATKKPLPRQGMIVQAAIITVRNPKLNELESTGEVRVVGGNFDQFRGEVKDLFVKAGAVIIGCCGDMVLAAFGSPLERLAVAYSPKTKPYSTALRGWEGSPAHKAARFVLDISSGNIKSGPWCFGIDFGECSFSWSPLTGYTAVGRPVVNARLLTRLCIRSKLTNLVSEEAHERINPVLMRPAAPHRKQGDTANYYELI